MDAPDAPGRAHAQVREVRRRVRAEGEDAEVLRCVQVAEGVGMSIHIESCPFCGSPGMLDTAHALEYTSIEPRGGDLHVNMDGFGYYWVMCGMCGANGPKYHGEVYGRPNTGPKNYRRDREKTAKAIATAVDAWNVRAQPTLWEVS